MRKFLIGSVMAIRTRICPFVCAGILVTGGSPKLPPHV